MQRLRVIALALGVLAVAGQSLLSGRAGQAPAASPPSSGAPFDTLHFRSIGPAAMSGRVSRKAQPQSAALARDNLTLAMPSPNAGGSNR